MDNERFDERVKAFVNFYSQELYDALDVKVFMFNEEESLNIIRSVMLTFLEQCVTNISPVSKET